MLHSLCCRLGSQPSLWQSARSVTQNYLTSSGCYPLGLYSNLHGMLYIQAFDLLEMLKKEEEMLSSIKEKQEKV